MTTNDSGNMQTLVMQFLSSRMYKHATAVAGASFEAQDAVRACVQDLRQINSAYDGDPGLAGVRGSSHKQLTRVQLPAQGTQQGCVHWLQTQPCCMAADSQTVCRSRWASAVAAAQHTPDRCGAVKYAAWLAAGAGSLYMKLQQQPGTTTAAAAAVSYTSNSMTRSSSSSSSSRCRCSSAHPSNVHRQPLSRRRVAVAAAAAAAPSSSPASLQDPPVVVVGAGMAGLAAAVALHKVGRAVHRGCICRHRHRGVTGVCRMFKYAECVGMRNV
jgi:hypothetical protein